MKAILLLTLLWSNVCLSHSPKDEIIRLKCEPYSEMMLALLQERTELFSELTFAFTQGVFKYALKDYQKFKEISEISLEYTDFHNKLIKYIKRKDEEETAISNKRSSGEITLVQYCKELHRKTKEVEKAIGIIHRKRVQLFEKIKNTAGTDSNKQVELEL